MDTTYAKDTDGNLVQTIPVDLSTLLDQVSSTKGEIQSYSDYIVSSQGKLEALYVELRKIQAVGIELPADISEALN